MPEFSGISCGIGALGFALLAASLLRDWRRSPVGRRLLVACTVSALWFGWQAVHYLGHAPGPGLVGALLLELARNLAWILLTLSLLAGSPGDARGQRLRSGARRVLGLAVVCALAVLLPPLADRLPLPAGALSKLTFGTMLVFPMLGMTLIEQFYRNLPLERRWSVKYLCLGVGALHAYDFMLYADGFLFNAISPGLWAGRGLANALTIPLIGVAAARNREWQLNLFLSRKMVFYGTTLMGGGLYLLGVAAAGYYLRAYGGEWGDALRAVFLFAAVLLLVSVLGSVGLRSRLRLFLSRHFYRDKYEYGEIWLRFTNLLSHSDTRPTELPSAILRALADIMDATGGALWLRNPGGSFGLVASHETDPQRLREIAADHPLVAALAVPGEIIDLAREAEGLAVEGSQRVPGWLLEQPRAWLLVPVVHRSDLLAVVLLCESRTGETLGYEDRELLGTLGRQAAGYLALMQATGELSDARQFEAFNRLSAFLVHDLKNVVAQLSMVLRNSERHRDNPEFIADAFTTIGDAVARMNRMLGNLRQPQGGRSELLEVQDCLRQSITQLGSRRPVPVLVDATGERCRVRGNRDRFQAMIEHLVHNAQEATAATGRVEIRLERDSQWLLIDIADDGCGMSPEFIQNHLFKPFDTTKGKAGMGLGAYESLHIANAMGGRISVDSTPGAGTRFRVQLPLTPPGGTATAKIDREEGA